MELSNVNETIGEEEVGQLLENGGYKPFFHRTKESFFSKIVKYIGNLIITIIQIINIPIFIAGLLTIIEVVVKLWLQDFTLNQLRNNLMYLLIFIVAYFIIIQLRAKTKANMVSPEIDLLWAINFKKTKVRNLFYSIELEKKHRSSLTQVVQRNIEREISVREQELLVTIHDLEEVLKRVESTSSFPEETFKSFSRLTEIVTTPLLRSSNPRHSLEGTMDRILNQIINLNYFNGRVRQGTVMLLKRDSRFESPYLVIKGESNISDEVIRTKRIEVGEKFSGKIVEQGKLVFIDDIYSEEAATYGYGPDTSQDKSYNAIMGMPIRSKEGEGFETIGVINLHFDEDPHYTENERIEIEKTLDVYSHFIVTYLKIRENLAVNVV